MPNVNVLPVALYFLGLTPTVYTSNTPQPPEGFNIYCFFESSSSMVGILTDPSVTVYNAPDFHIGMASYDLIAESGGDAPNSDDAFLYIDAAVPSVWTMQVVVRPDVLPVDFTDLVHQHLYFGTLDQEGAAAGLFVSSVGLAYAPRVLLSGGDLILDGPFQPIPGTSTLFENGVSYTFRVATDNVTGTTYVFATATDQVLVTGHQLVAVLPTVSGVGTEPEGTVLSVRGTSTRGVSAAFAQVCLGAGLIMPNIPPRADAGRDQAIRACTVGVLNGTASFDPDGGNILYQWRLIDAPVTSAFAFEGADGFTLPMVSPSGFSDKFYSAELGVSAALDDVVTGDVLLVGGVAWSITGTGIDGHGYYAQFAAAVVSDSLTNAAFKLLRSRSLSNADTATPSFLSDVAGIYRFDLRVFDGQYLSEPSVTIVNVLESQVPRGCIPDLGFVWSYLSDFWNLVEDRERIQVFWEGLAQVTAAELLNLWQVDYSKSLRDIQRQFQRRWLHYDLKLPEPVPELTAVRQVRAGVRSTGIAASGVSDVQGTSVTVKSPTHADVLIPFQLPNPYFAADVQALLLTKLRGVSVDYTVTLVAGAGGLEYLRINAPFQFSIDASTTFPYLSAAASTSPHGTTGQRITSRVYRVDSSLLGTDVFTNDVLVIGEEGYLVSRVVDDESDDERFQRIVVQEDLPLITSSTWSVSGHVTSKLLDFYNGQVSQGDIVVLELQDLSDNSIALVEVPAVGACADMASRLALDLSSIDAYVSQPAKYAVFLAYVMRKTRLPIGALVMDIPFLQEFIKETDDGAVLRRNVDYFIEESRGANSLRFLAGPPQASSDVWQGTMPPVRMWAETTYLDNSPAIESNFGIPADLTAEQLSDLGTDADYLSSVRGLWYTLINGPTMFNLRAGTQILLGLPFAEENGTITEIRTDFSPTQGRVLVQDLANAAIVRSYSFPKLLHMEVNPSTGLPYAEGDSVVQFAPLVSGAEVIDYVKDPAWFSGIINQGVFFEVEKFHKFLVRVDSKAFNLSALLFVQNFVRRVKPTYTQPKFVVREEVGDTEVSATDEATMSGRLILEDGACFPNFNSATSFDDYRAAGGGVRNKYDQTSDTAVADPTYPTPTTPITWGFDKKYLCPEDEISISYCVSHSAGVVAYDSGFKFDGGNAPSHHFTDTGITAVAAGPTGFTMTGTSTVSVTGNIVSLRVVISGTLGADPGDYELVVHKNSTDVGVYPITVAPSGYLGTVTAALAVASGDVVSVRIRPATGGARHPVWSYLSVTLGQDPVTFAFDAGLPAGTYCFVDVV